MKATFTPLLITLLIFISCQKKTDPKDKPEIMLGGVLHLESSKDEVVEQFKKHFSKCEDSRGETVCYWDKGNSFLMVVFKDNKIVSATFDGPEMLLSDVIAHFRNTKTEFKIEPIQMGQPVDADMLDVISRGGMKIIGDAKKVKKGDTLNLACNAVLSHLDGKVEYMGSYKDFIIKDCDESNFDKLVVTGYIYSAKKN